MRSTRSDPTRPAALKDLGRRSQKPEDEAAAPGTGRAAIGQLAQDFQVPRGHPASLRLDRAGWIQLEVGRVDDHVHAVESTEFLELDVRELGLRGAAPPQHDDLTDLASAKCGERMIGDVRHRQRFRIGDQDASDVHGHVSVPHHDRPIMREVERSLGKVRMAVVPGDEFGSRVTAVQLLTRNAEAPVGLGAGRVYHLVIVVQQISAVHVISERDVSEEPHRGRRRDAIVLRGDLLDRRVVGGHTFSDQAVRRGEAVEHIDRADEIRGPEQRVRREETSRTGAHDRHAKRTFLGPLSYAHRRGAASSESGGRCSRPRKA